MAKSSTPKTLKLEFIQLNQNCNGRYLSFKFDGRHCHFWLLDDNTVKDDKLYKRERDGSKVRICRASAFANQRLVQSVFKLAKERGLFDAPKEELQMGQPVSAIDWGGQERARRERDPSTGPIEERARAREALAPGAGEALALDTDALKAEFEASVNATSDFYNFTPAVAGSGNTYWSLHTERAWQVFQLGARAALKGVL